ncbi:MAG: chemotaxis-specific protein-glutamate methyltransferase CheB [Acidobacteria bacterium]|nr:chemotaxis-specific protein-glutamate methyltransferase CheB [Acidobacteriota bacterium]
MKKIRVLIVEDSPVMREFLKYIIGRDPRLEVAAAADSAEEALRLLPLAAPDVISLDIRLPGMNGFEATRRIMSERPTPIVVVSASVESEELNITMNALRAGALTVMEKPVGTTQGEYESLAEPLCTQLAIMSQVRLVRQRPTELRPRSTTPTAPSGRVYRLLAIATSTGGPQALVEVLGGLGKGFPLPILVVQHIAPSFLKGFAAWLASVCAFPVEVVENQSVMSPGRVYLAAADHHLRADGRQAWADGGDPVCAQRPSGTVLFQSLARHLGPQSLGVVLTGMGEDGAQGLLELRRAGGYTIAEDESTAVVYGMPAAAVRLGAACESLPLPAIAPRILELL